MKKSLFEAFQERVKDEPFARKLGLRLQEVRAGYARVEMSVTPELDNIHGMVHGGAVFSLIDEAFQIASNSHGTVAVALNMSISYLSPAKPETTLMAEAKEFHRTRKTAHYDIQVTDDEGTLIARCGALVYRKSDTIPFIEESR
jgi:acyl-CoA thioesterase